MGAIFWKDLRDGRTLMYGLLASITLVCMLPNEFAELWAGFLSFFLVPMFCAHAGANLLANELSDEQLPFLLTLPMSRRQLWIAKLSAGLLSCLLVLGFAAALLLPRLLRPWMSPNEVFLLAAVGTTGCALSYGLGTFFSVACDRPLTATFLAYMTAVLGWISHLLLIEKTRVHQAESADRASFIYAWIWAALLLAASGFIFTRSDLMDRQSCRRDCVRAGLLIVLVTLSIFGIYSAIVTACPELRKPWYR